MKMGSPIGRDRTLIPMKQSRIDWVACPIGQLHFGIFTRTKRKRVNELRQIHSLARRARLCRKTSIRVAVVERSDPTGS